MYRPIRPAIFFLLLIAAALSAQATNAATPPPRGKGPPRARAPQAPRCDYQVQITDLRAEPLDRLPPGWSAKGWNAPMMIHITLQNKGTGAYTFAHDDDLEIMVGASNPSEASGKFIRDQRVREMRPGQSLRLHWTYDYNTRDPQLPTHNAYLEARIMNACNPSYIDVARKTRRAYPVLEWARDAYSDDPTPVDRR